MKIEFELTKEQEDKYRAWWKEQNAKGVKQQLEDLDKREAEGFKDFNPFARKQLEAGCLLSGCVGGGPIWILKETSIGTVLVVQHWFTKEELDLTDYDSW